MGTTERLGRIEEKRDALLERLGRVDPGRLLVRPEPESWSIREIVEHLVLSEETVLADLDDPASRGTRSPSLRDRALYWLVLLILRFDVPVRAPSRSMVPSGELPLDELRRRWEQKHRRLRRFLEDVPGKRAGRPIFHHPVAGPLRPSQALQMIEVHLDHHARQIQDRLRR